MHICVLRCTCSECAGSHIHAHACIYMHCTCTYMQVWHMLYIALQEFAQTTWVLECWCIMHVNFLVCFLTILTPHWSNKQSFFMYYLGTHGCYRDKWYGLFGDTPILHLVREFAISTIWGKHCCVVIETGMKLSLQLLL